VPVYQMQFHAERDELIAIAAGWADRHVLMVVLERFYPEYEPVAMPDAMSLPEAVRELEPVRRICLGRMAMRVGGGILTQEDFIDVNRDCLAIALEPITEDGLRECALGTLTAEPHTLDHWLELVLELEQITHHGATVVDPRSGARRHMPEHRHTAGAHKLASSGVRMLAAAGERYFEFDDVIPGVLDL